LSSDVKKMISATEGKDIKNMSNFESSVERNYYPTSFRIDGQLLYLIWYSTDWYDGVLKSDNNVVLVFKDLKQLKGFANDAHLRLVNDTELALHDFDAIAKWIDKPRGIEVDCNLFLSAWNLIDDLRSSLGLKLKKEDKMTRKIYGKLFWGNNLPAVTPPGEIYIPSWSGRELFRIKTNFSSGLKLIREHLIRSNLDHTKVNGLI